MNEIAGKSVKIISKIQKPGGGADPMRRYGKIKSIIKRNQAQSMTEAAFALPIVFLLFAGCLQLLQIGVASVVVKVAIFEAGRQAQMDELNLDNGRKVAEEICHMIGKGRIEFSLDNSVYSLTFHLKALVPVVKDIVIRQTMPASLFHAGDGG